MRTTRAFIAGLGTSGSLVGAAGCLFLVASALLVFNGWPGGGISNPIGNLFVRDAPAVPFDVPGPTLVARSAGAAASTVAAFPVGPVVGAGGGSLTPTGGGGGSVFVGTTSPSSGVPAPERPTPGGRRTTAGGPAGPALPGLPVSADPIRSGAGAAVENDAATVGSAVTAATGGAGAAVERANPSGGGSIRGAGQSAGDAASQTGRALGDTVRGSP